jgi:hypothetical protein
MKMMRQGKLPGITTLSQYSAPCDTYATCAKTHSGPRAGPGYRYTTSSGWASVLTGLDNSVHGIKDNSATQVQAFWKRSLTVPTIFHLTSHSTAVFAKPYIIGTPKVPGILDRTPLHTRVTAQWDEKDGDVKLANAFIDSLTNGNARTLNFIHLDTADQTGHKHGFGFNAAYKNALMVVDRIVERVVHAVNNRKDEEWLMILTSDHGGSGTVHRISEGEDDQIPFLMSRVPIGGPEVATQMDVVSTTLRWLGEPVPTAIKHYGFTF